MAPPGSTQVSLSPAELSYLHSSLALNPPIRPDLRSPTEFRQLVAESDILPSTNGSARVCFSDGTEAIVGVKAEVEKTQRTWRIPGKEGDEDIEMQSDSESDAEEKEHDRPGQKAGTQSGKQKRGLDSWLEISIEIPGFRDDDGLPVFLAAMLTEALLASGTLRDKLYINENWHWKLYIDVLLLSPPLSYPLPLLSLTTHLALLNTALPRLISEPDDDPLFDDDWAAAVLLYPHNPKSKVAPARPPISLLVMTIGDNIIFDPSKEELAVAESVIAISIATQASIPSGSDGGLTLLAVRTIDPPSRMTPLGVANSANPTTTAGAITPGKKAKQDANDQDRAVVWSPPRGGMKRGLLTEISKMVLREGGVGEEILNALSRVET